jgi:hypothetical protein
VFIREKTNKSGSTSIQLIEKRQGRSVIIETIGCSSDPDVIAKYKLAAKSLIEQKLDQLNLPFNYEVEFLWFDHAFSHMNDIQSIGPELILGKLFDEIGFNKVKDRLFRYLVRSRIVRPVRKLRTTRYLREYFNQDYSVKQNYSNMDKLHQSQKTTIEKIGYKHTLGVLRNNISIVFYDVTTICFEAEKEDDLRISGFSKDGKHKHPQILLGLLVSSVGIRQSIRFSREMHLKVTRCWPL